MLFSKLLESSILSGHEYTCTSLSSGIFVERMDEGDLNMHYKHKLDKHANKFLLNNFITNSLPF